MRRCCWSCLVSLFISVLVAPSSGRITHASIEEDARRSITLSRPFGFTNAGDPHIWLTISNPQLHHKGERDYELQCFGFYLAETNSEVLPTVTKDGECNPAVANPGIKVTTITDFDEDPIPSWLNGERGEETEQKYTFKYANKRRLIGGLHTLYFVNCCNEDPEVAVSFDIVTEMWNEVGVNGEKSYLSVGEIELPHMYMVMCVLFIVGLGAFAYHVVANKEHAHRIHYLMIALGAFKVLTLLSQFGMYHYIRVTGEPDGWNVAYYIFTFFRSVFLFTVIILIGTGWSYMTPFLGEKERRVLVIVLPLQVVMDVLIIVMDEFTPAQRAWFAWRDLMNIVDIVCCCSILFPIAWRIRHLRDAAATDGKAERSMQQLVMFRHFYVMVVVYIYFTRIVVRLMEATLEAEYVWLSKAALELATLFFYTLTAVLFQPQGATQTYTRLVTADEIEMGSF